MSAGPDNGRPPDRDEAPRSAPRDSPPPQSAPSDRPTERGPGRAPGADTGTRGRAGADPAVADPERPAARFGGIQWGSAFFGWLTATGAAVLLTTVAVVGAAAFGLATSDPAAAQTAGIIGTVVLVLIIFLAYYCGGYVAGRMARFSGALQGVAVWVWAVVIGLVVAGLGALAGAQLDLSALTGGLPVPADAGALTTGGIIAVLVALAIALAGAVLGGMAGMRFHRRVDRQLRAHPA